jgi:hypothetical protein
VPGSCYQQMVIGLWISSGIQEGWRGGWSIHIAGCIKNCLSVVVVVMAVGGRDSWTCCLLWAVYMYINHENQIALPPCLLCVGRFQRLTIRMKLLLSCRPLALSHFFLRLLGARGTTSQNSKDVDVDIHSPYSWPLSPYLLQLGWFMGKGMGMGRGCTALAARQLDAALLRVMPIYRLPIFWSSNLQSRRVLTAGSARLFARLVSSPISSLGTRLLVLPVEESADSLSRLC